MCGQFNDGATITVQDIIDVVSSELGVAMVDEDDASYIPKETQCFVYQFPGDTNYTLIKCGAATCTGSGPSTSSPSQTCITVVQSMLGNVPGRILGETQLLTIGADGCLTWVSTTPCGPSLSSSSS
jgi:hypothetical protein